MIAIRRHLGLTQAAFAARLGITQSGYSLIEKGRRRPSVDILGALEAEFGIAPSVIVGHDADEMVSELEIERDMGGGPRALSPRHRATLKLIASAFSERWLDVNDVDDFIAEKRRAAEERAKKKR